MPNTWHGPKPASASWRGFFGVEASASYILKGLASASWFSKASPSALWFTIASVLQPIFLSRIKQSISFLWPILIDVYKCNLTVRCQKKSSKTDSLLKNPMFIIMQSWDQHLICRIFICKYTLWPWFANDCFITELHKSIESLCRIFVQLSFSLKMARAGWTNNVSASKHAGIMISL